MKTRITFTATADVYDEADARDPAGSVRHALFRGDTHAGDYTTFMGQVLSVAEVGDDE
jgi:hypothetical protein